MFRHFGKGNPCVPVELHSFTLQRNPTVLIYSPGVVKTDIYNNSSSLYLSEIFFKG